MGKIEETLKREITRLARRELKKELAPLAKNIRKLRRNTLELKKSVTYVQKSGAYKAPAQGTALAPTPSAKEIRSSRLSPTLIRKLRKRLGVTQSELGTLVGASLSTVTFWEQGRFKPRPEKRAALIALRNLGRRDVAILLAEKAQSRAPKAATRKKRAPRRKKRK